MMESNTFLVYLVTCAGVLIATISGFNISPKPNIVFREPELKIYQPKVHTSYFGFSLNLREHSLIVGAPRAQSTLESQRNVNETGAIYKCSINQQTCNPFIFDTLGNTIVENSEHTYDSEKKDNQWLGASMDGGNKETDRLVVCAPRLLANLPKDYLIHGICYWTPNTLQSSPVHVRKIAPLRLKNKQIKYGEYGTKFYDHMFGEQGISVHITEDNEQILMGAPGVHMWKGSMVRYYAKAQEDIGLSRRETLRNNSRTGVVKRETLEFVSEVPNPALWEQPNDSYFGYSVTSGFFEGEASKKILYVASAPQANEQGGEVYLFDIINTPYGEQSIKKYDTFYGDQFGEFFGYAVLSDDFDGDGLTDVVISAPMYKIGTSFDNGAVYVFLNKGQFEFEKAKKLTTGIQIPSRFGTTLSKIGDINRDGYNDLAVGAPFEGNGAVYIFLGGPRGLSDKPSQILTDPGLRDDQYVGHMFGHGISKGSDIDNNQYNDLAIGAPNAEVAYLYRTYPVVKVNAYLKSVSREIKIDQSKFQVHACWQLEYNTGQGAAQDLKIKIVVDNQLKRAHLSNGNNQLEFKTIGTRDNQCKLIDVNVRFSAENIFKPIVIDMFYELVKKIPNTEVFCETCAAIDPSDPVVTTERIAFSTGCKDQICVADLKLSINKAPTSFVLGSSNTISLNYNVVNRGETSYLTQINITSSNQTPFAKIPSNCILLDSSILCNLLNGHPMSKGDEASFTVDFDVSHLTGTAMIISASVSSTGDEVNPEDNVIDTFLELKEFSEIEVSGKPITPVLNLDDGLGIKEITNVFEIRNHGPSIIKQLNVILSIPVSYLIPNSQSRIPLIDFSDIKINATYNKKDLEISFMQNNTILIQNAIVSHPTTLQPPPINNVAPDDSFDTNNFAEGFDGQNSQNDVYENIMARRKRNAPATSNYAAINQRKENSKISGGLAGSLPINRTVFFNCNDPTETLCIQAKLTVLNMIPGDLAISIMSRFRIDLQEIDKILLENKDFFVITTDLDLAKLGDEQGKTMNVVKTLPHNIISKHQLQTTPIWIYIVSILGGILLLVLISYALYKFGFFKREKKEELEKLHRESQRINTDDPDDDE